MNLHLRYDVWSLLALCRFMLASIVAVNHVAEYATPGWLAFVPRFGAFEAILGFLLISGFSIGSSFSKQPEGFLKRRAWRIWPIYLAAMGLAWLAIGDPITPRSLGVIAQNLLFLNQLTTTSSYVGPAWSLSLEVWLYCLTPWLALRSTSTIRAAMYVSFGAYCGFEVCRSGFHWPYYSGVGLGLNLVLLSFAWLCGFALSRPGASRTLILKDCALLFMGHIALALLIQAVHRTRHGQLDLLFTSDLVGFVLRAATLMSIWLLFLAVARGAMGIRRSFVMRFLGDVSYPLYLIHGSVFVLAMRVIAPNAMQLLAVALVSAAFIYFGLDSYSRRRERMSFSATQSSGAAEPAQAPPG